MYIYNIGAKGHNVEDYFYYAKWFSCQNMFYLHLEVSFLVFMHGLFVCVCLLIPLKYISCEFGLWFTNTLDHLELKRLL